MALEFDITCDPPSLAEITDEREEAVKNRAIFRKKNIYSLVLTVVILVLLVCFQVFVSIPALDSPGVAPTFVAVVAYITPYVIFSFFIVGNSLHIKFIENPSKALDAMIADLEEAKQEELSEIIGAGQQNIGISCYQGKVASQGRPLVRAEVNAIKKWLSDHNQVV